MGTVEKATNLSLAFNDTVTRDGITVKKKRQLAKILNIREENFYPVCKKNNIFVEIRFCYSFENTPDTEKLIKCPNVADNGGCSYPMQIKGYNSKK